MPDRRAIMQEAWKLYRQQTAHLRNLPFQRDWFSAALKWGWKIVSDRQFEAQSRARIIRDIDLEAVLAARREADIRWIEAQFARAA